MTRSRFRGLLIIGLLASTGFAAWTWFRPYSWSPDPAARCRVVGSQLRKDQSFYWLELHLKVNDGETHDLARPVLLVMADGREIEPADTTLGGSEERGTSDLWFKFWLEEADLQQPLRLRINEGSLVIRSGTGVPRLGASNQKFFATSGW